MQDLVKDIRAFKKEGDNMILVIDGSLNMRSSDLVSALHAFQLKEVIISKHGCHGPSTYWCNIKDVPIDGIWTMPSIQISACGYFAYDEGFLKTDHRCLWLDL
jgi:hypothetical protein